MAWHVMISAASRVAIVAYPVIADLDRLWINAESL